MIQIEREKLDKVLEALERSVATCFNQYAHQQVMSQPDHFINTAITAIKEALAQHDSVQAKPEPEQWGASAVTQPEYVAEQKRKTEELRSMLAQTQEPTNIERHEANVQKFLGAPQPEQEPVEIYRNQCADGSRCLHGCHTNEPCYTTPPQRKPLTDEQIDEEFKLYASKFDTSSDKWLDMGADDYFKAGFKAAHGIKE